MEGISDGWLAGSSGEGWRSGGGCGFGGNDQCCSSWRPLWQSVSRRWSILAILVVAAAAAASDNLVRFSGWVAVSH